MLGREDPLLTLEPLQHMIEDWRAFLRQLEKRTGMILLPRKRGPKPEMPGKKDGGPEIPTDRRWRCQSFYQANQGSDNTPEGNRSRGDLRSLMP